MVSAPLQLTPWMVPSETVPGGLPCIAVIESSPPACTNPPVTVAEIFGSANDSAVNPAWMSMRPPEVASAKESASVNAWANSFTLPEAVISPPPNRACTSLFVRASAVDAETAMSPMFRLSTLALVASSPMAVTSISAAPGMPTVPTAGSAYVVPTSPFSSAFVMA